MPICAILPHVSRRCIQEFITHTFCVLLQYCKRSTRIPEELRGDLKGQKHPNLRYPTAKLTPQFLRSENRTLTHRIDAAIE